MRLPYEGWRALARTAALCNYHDEALIHVREMRANGHRPHLDDFQMLLMRFSQASRKDLCESLCEICEQTEKPTNPFLPWRRRSTAISVLLEKAYGKGAPKPATNAATDRIRHVPGIPPEPPVNPRIMREIVQLERTLKHLQLRSSD